MTNQEFIDSFRHDQKQENWWYRFHPVTKMIFCLALGFMSLFVFKWQVGLVIFLIASIIAMTTPICKKYFATIFISTRKCCFYAVFRYLSSDLLHFYSNFKPIFSVQLLLLFSFLLKRACINRLSLPMWNDLRVSALPVGLLHFHNTL